MNLLSMNFYRLGCFCRLDGGTNSSWQRHFGFGSRRDTATGERLEERKICAKWQSSRVEGQRADGPVDWEVGYM